MSAERLIRVTSESELRPGMLVVVRPCPLCRGSDHRTMLLGLSPHRTPLLGMPLWRVTNGHGPINLMNTTIIISEGALYRVDLGDLTERTDECERERVE